MTYSTQKHAAVLLLLIGMNGCGGSGGGTTVPPPPPPPASATETVTFALSDFSEISVGASFEVTVQQSDTFGVQLTLDQGLQDLLTVTRQVLGHRYQSRCCRPQQCHGDQAG